ncbi:uncharacterized protein M421DRAFT_322475 [Didymella exigua CBS 183.55]|uniref:Uncharacterized protein n=1 Tax=Didymella exigua CBS 183.55 TaxID=1150837 RepID=A0A6A5RWC0_9PLEO|nr:uncharacterized protein M421DRAFT_322475 [Didymella exigua CBS 183.55]KAF1931873.1 hypothetical protein M421DRAFT_322475 [Didymella exigua CBS 183.55]
MPAKQSMSSHQRTALFTISAAAEDKGGLRVCSHIVKYAASRQRIPTCSRRWDVKREQREQDGMLLHIAQSRLIRCFERREALFGCLTTWGMQLTGLCFRAAVGGCFGSYPGRDWSWYETGARRRA